MQHYMAVPPLAIDDEYRQNSANTNHHQSSSSTLPILNFDTANASTQTLSVPLRNLQLQQNSANSNSNNNSSNNWQHLTMDNRGSNTVVSGIECIAPPE